MPARWTDRQSTEPWTSPSGVHTFRRPDGDGDGLRNSIGEIETEHVRPQYTELYERMLFTGCMLLAQWVDISHYVMRARLRVRGLNLFRSAYEPRRRATRRDAGERGAIVEECRIHAAKAEAQYRALCAIWNAMEAALTRFCGERGLPVDALFAVVTSWYPVVDEARHGVAAEVPADPERAEAEYQALCHAVAGQNPGERPQPGGSQWRSSRT